MVINIFIVFAAVGATMFVANYDNITGFFVQDNQENFRTGIDDNTDSPNIQNPGNNAVTGTSNAGNVDSNLDNDNEQNTESIVASTTTTIVSTTTTTRPNTNFGGGGGGSSNGQGNSNPTTTTTTTLPPQEVFDGEATLIETEDDSLNFYEPINNIIFRAGSNENMLLDSASISVNKVLYRYDQVIEMPDAQIIYTNESNSSANGKYLKFGRKTPAWTYSIIFERNVPFTIETRRIKI